MKEIKLSQGKVAFVDDKDFERLNKHKWYADKSKLTYYAKTNVFVDGKKTTIRMHRFILEATDKKNIIDHVDTNGLNNQRLNLRICSNMENIRNQNPRKGCSSKYKGVSFNKKHNRWTAFITVERKVKYLGAFVDEITAAKTYDINAKLYFKEFANVNFK